MSPFVRHPTVRHADRVAARSVFVLVLVLLSAGLPRRATSPGGEAVFDGAAALAHGHLAGGEGGERAPLGQVLLSLPAYGAGVALDRLFASPVSATAAVEGRPFARAPFSRALVTWVGVLLSALTAWLIVLVTRRLGAERLHAWLAGLGYGCSTFAWPEAYSGLEWVAGACLCLTAFHLLLRMRERFDRLESPRRRALVGIGSALAWAWLAAPSLRLAVIVLAGVLEVVYIRGHRRLASSRWMPRHKEAGRGGAGGWLVGILPLIVALAIGLALDRSRAGVWFDLAPFERAEAPAKRLGVLLVSPSRGLWVHAPLLLLLPWGLAACRREGERLFPRTLGLLSLAVVLPAVVLVARGEPCFASPGPLLPLLPFLWVGATLALGTAAQSPALRSMALVLAAVGVLVQLPAILVDPLTTRDLFEEARLQTASDQSCEELAFAEGFELPLVRWRILRHRISGMPDRFDPGEIFHREAATDLEPRAGAPPWQHLLWVDLVVSHRVPAWLLIGLLAGLLGLGVGLSASALHPGRP